MITSVCIVDTHPVQYRAPLYRELEAICPGLFTVIYGSDFSVRGYHDAGFGRSFAWDVPLLEGYPYMIASTGKPHDLAACWKTLRHLWCARPRALLLTDVQGPLYWTGYLAAMTLGIDLWVRMETQDQAYQRTWLKSRLRSLFYHIAYLPMARVFYIGELNRQHYLRHGVDARRLFRSPYCTVDRMNGRTGAQKQQERAHLRKQLGLSSEHLVVAFMGKLIPKKNPDLLLDAAERMAPDLRRRIALLFVGSGELESSIRQRIAAMSPEASGPAILAGFVNQFALPAYYLAADIVVLPSRQAGETWGLVVNEALQAGCAVVVSRAVGCAVEFASLPRVRVIGVEDADALARAVTELAQFPRDFLWAAAHMDDYSVACAAQGIIAGGQARSLQPCS